MLVDILSVPFGQAPKIEPVVPKRISGSAGSSPLAQAPVESAAVAAKVETTKSRLFCMAFPHRPVTAILPPNRLCRHRRSMLQSRKSFVPGTFYSHDRVSFEHHRIAACAACGSPKHISSLLDITYCMRHLLREIRS